MAGGTRLPGISGDKQSSFQQIIEHFERRLDDRLNMHQSQLDEIKQQLQSLQLMLTDVLKGLPTASSLPTRTEQAQVQAGGAPGRVLPAAAPAEEPVKRAVPEASTAKLPPPAKPATLSPPLAAKPSLPLQAAKPSPPQTAKPSSRLESVKPSLPAEEAPLEQEDDEWREEEEGEIEVTPDEDLEAPAPDGEKEEAAEEAVAKAREAEELEVVHELEEGEEEPEEVDVEVPAAGPGESQQVAEDDEEIEDEEDLDAIEAAMLEELNVGPDEVEEEPLEPPAKRSKGQQPADPVTSTGKRAAEGAPEDADERSRPKPNLQAPPLGYGKVHRTPMFDSPPAPFASEFVKWPHGPTASTSSEAVAEASEEELRWDFLQWWEKSKKPLAEWLKQLPSNHAWHQRPSYAPAREHDASKEDKATGAPEVRVSAPRSEEPTRKTHQVAAAPAAQPAPQKEALAPAVPAESSLPRPTSKGKGKKGKGKTSAKGGKGAKGGPPAETATPREVSRHAASDSVPPSTGKGQAPAEPTTVQPATALRPEEAIPYEKGGKGGKGGKALSASQKKKQEWYQQRYGAAEDRPKECQKGSKGKGKGKDREGKGGKGKRSRTGPEPLVDREEVDLYAEPPPVDDVLPHL